MRYLLLMAALLALPAAAAAQQRAELARAKSYFNAGAAAYEMGDYAAAIQALDAAYRLTPLPAIAFSLAQAERRQYFVSREPQHLQRAIELYRVYLSQVESGGRRADATDALAQLEPLAALHAQEESARAPAESTADKTRLMISCAAPRARVVLDQGEGMASPAIARVEPGMHHVRVSAPGHFDVERSVEAVAGELIPIEVVLRERPASVLLRAEPEAELHLDGNPSGSVGEAPRQVSLASGAHSFAFTRNGHHAELVRTQLAPGDTREIAVHLEPTQQRTAAITLFVVSGAALVAGGLFSALALEREQAADELLVKGQSQNISQAELHDYDEAKKSRNNWRVAAISSFAVSAGACITGLFLYALDEPDLDEAGPELRVALPLPGRAQNVGVTGRLRF